MGVQTLFAAWWNEPLPLLSLLAPSKNLSIGRDPHTSILPLRARVPTCLRACVCVCARTRVCVCVRVCARVPVPHPISHITALTASVTAHQTCGREGYPFTTWNSE